MKSNDWPDKSWSETNIKNSKNTQNEINSYIKSMKKKSSKKEFN